MFCRITVRSSSRISITSTWVPTALCPHRTKLIYHNHKTDQGTGLKISSTMVWNYLCVPNTEGLLPNHASRDTFWNS
jgi:hypothetical protein